MDVREWCDAINAAGSEAGLEKVGWNARLRRALEKRGFAIYSDRPPTRDNMTAPLPFGDDEDAWPASAVIERVTV